MSLTKRPIRIFVGGKLLSNYVAHTDITEYKYICPLGKRWLLIGGRITRPTSSTLNCWVYDPDDNQVLQFDALSAGTTELHYPTPDKYIDRRFPIILDPLWYVRITWGTQQANAISSCVVLEINR